MSTVTGLSGARSPSTCACGSLEGASATPSQTRAIQQRIHTAIAQHAHRLAEIALSGGIAILVIDPKGCAKKAARRMGWDAVANPAAFPMPTWATSAMSKTDTVFAAWAAADKNVARIFVIMDKGNLLLNFAPNRGYYLEPGSLDSERV